MLWGVVRRSRLLRKLTLPAAPVAKLPSSCMVVFVTCRNLTSLSCVRPWSNVVPCCETLRFLWRRWALFCRSMKGIVTRWGYHLLLQAALGLVCSWRLGSGFLISWQGLGPVRGGEIDIVRVGGERVQT